jgi:hypothetical protein
MRRGDITLLHSTDGFHGLDWGNQWRTSRSLKLLNVLGEDWFEGKRILELGCGSVSVGIFFKSFGADVTSTDIRKENLDLVKQKDPTAKTIKLNQDVSWDLEEKFDLVIHWALLYNLDHWYSDLLCSLNHTVEYFCLETAVTKYKEPVETKIVNPNYEHYSHGPANNIGSLVSASNIENIFKEQNFSFVRYDDPSMNNPIAGTYDWTEENITKEVAKNPHNVHGWWNNQYTDFPARRFWLAKRST